MRTILLLVCLCIFSASPASAKDPTESAKSTSTTTATTPTVSKDPTESAKSTSTTTATTPTVSKDPTESAKSTSTTTATTPTVSKDPTESAKSTSTTTATTPTVSKGTTESDQSTPTTTATRITVSKGRKCSDEDVKRCGGTCVLENGRPVCNCRPNQRKDVSGCTDDCSSQLLMTCVPGRCIIVDHHERCECIPPFEDDGQNGCTLKRLSYTLKLKVVRSPRLKRSVDICPEAAQVTRSVKELYPDAEEVDILGCPDGEYNIHLVFKAEVTFSELEKRIKACNGVRGRPDVCVLPGNLTVEKKSLELDDEDLCDSVLKDYIKELNQNHVCQKERREYVLNCADKFRSLGANEVPLSRDVLLTVHYCSEVPCNNVTCPEHNRACVEGKCVCKKGFVQQGDDCIDACSKNPCKNGGTCKQHPEVNFLCLCPAKFKGLQCEEDNLELRGAKLNVVIVGVVLAVLLLLALIVSASVISRMKKKQGMLDDSSKELGVQSRHAYEGPYNASAPVYNSDNTML